MPDIYDEALADRKKLLEVAENNAKNKILDAVTPRIKELVESALLGKLNEELGDDDVLIDIDVPPSEDTIGDPLVDELPGLDDEIAPVDPIGVDPMVPDLTGVPDDGVAGGEEAGVTLPDQDGKVTLDIDTFMAAPSDQAPSPGQFELTPESVKILSALVGTHVVDFNAVNERLDKMTLQLKRLVKNTDPQIKENEQARQIKLECERIYADIQASRDVLDESKAHDAEKRLEKIFHRVMEHYSAAGHLTAIAKEMLSINRRAAELNKQISESRRPTGANVDATAQLMREVMDLHTIVGKLYETLGKDDSIDAGSVRVVANSLSTLYTEIRNMVTKKGKQINEADELDVGADVAGGEAEAGVDADQYLVQLKLPASLDALAGGGSVEVVSAEPAPADDDMGMDMDGMDDMGGLDDMGAGDELGDEGMPEDDMEEADMAYEAKLRDDDIIEIDEAALVAEMKKMKKLREKKKVGTAGIKNVNTGGHGPAHFDAFGGGKDEGESFVDGEDLNAHDPVGSEGYLEEGEDLEEMDEMEESDGLEEADLTEDDSEEEDLDEGDLEETARPKAGRKTRQPSKEKQLAEAYQKARAELAGQKLFNTKLVALNRVLQIPGLKQAQKEKVVEILDKGRTVAEVKQLYTKIVETLKREKKAVTESAQPVAKGSASRATTSGASKVDSEAHPLLEKWQKIAFGGSGLLQG